MNSSGGIVLKAVLPLLLLSSACTGDPINLEEPQEVDSCRDLVEVGIELVNDYVYTLEEADLGATGGDPEELPVGIVALNTRGAELDARLIELDCDVVAINAEIAEATEGIESDDQSVQVFLESVRGGIVSPILPTYGDWVLETGVISNQSIEPTADNPITLTIERDEASGFGGCNGYFYPVRLVDGSWMRIAGSATLTEVDCSGTGGADESGVMATEAAFISALELVAVYRIDGDALVLSGDGVELRFVRSAGN